MAQDDKCKYYEKGSNFSLKKFWADHKLTVPIHYLTYLAEVGPKKIASSNVESVFSGAGKFSDEAKSAGHTLLERVVKLHYNWKYKFLQPLMKTIIDRYNFKHGHTNNDKTPVPAPTHTPVPAPMPEAGQPDPVTPA